MSGRAKDPFAFDDLYKAAGVADSFGKKTLGEMKKPGGPAAPVQPAAPAAKQPSATGPVYRAAPQAPARPQTNQQGLFDFDDILGGNGNKAAAPKPPRAAASSGDPFAAFSTVDGAATPVAAVRPPSSGGDVLLDLDGLLGDAPAAVSDAHAPQVAPAASLAGAPSAASSGYEPPRPSLAPRSVAAAPSAHTAPAPDALAPSQPPNRAYEPAGAAWEEPRRPPPADTAQRGISHSSGGSGSGDYHSGGAHEWTQAEVVGSSAGGSGGESGWKGWLKKLEKGGAQLGKKALKATKAGLTYIEQVLDSIDAPENKGQQQGRQDAVEEQVTPEQVMALAIKVSEMPERRQEEALLKLPRGVRQQVVALLREHVAASEAVTAAHSQAGSAQREEEAAQRAPAPQPPAPQPPAPQPPAPQPQPHASRAAPQPAPATGDLLDAFESQQPAARPAAAPAAGTDAGSVDSFFAGGGSPKPAAPPAASAKIAAAAAASGSNLDDFFSGGGGSSGGGSSGSSRPGAAGTSKPRATIDMGLDGLDNNNSDLYADNHVDDPNEPEIRKQLRQQRLAERNARMAAALAEKVAKEEAEAHRREEQVRLKDQFKGKVEAWRNKNKGNLRGLLISLHTVLWEDSGWKPLGMSELMEPPQVKKAYMKANLVVHPDKVKQRNGTDEMMAVADMVFDALKEAWGKFS